MYDINFLEFLIKPRKGYELFAKFGNENDRMILSNENYYYYNDIDNTHILNEDGKDVLIKHYSKILEEPKLLNKIKNVLDKEIRGEDENKLLLFLLMLTKNLGKKESQAIFIMGDSSGGKSYVTHKVLDLFPEDDVIWRTRLSAHGLEYMGEGKNLDNHILYVEEAQGVNSSSDSIRPMFSEKGLHVSVVENVGGRLQGKEVLVEGCPVFVTTTAVPIIEDQLSTRSWILQIDESEEQTKGILDYLAKEMMSITEDEDDIEKKRLCWAFQSLELPDKILIPFADKIKFPTNKVRARRDFSKFGTLIKISAYLHQKNRPWVKLKDKKCLIATLADYHIAYVLSKDNLKPTMYGIPRSVLDLLRTCKEIEGEITSRKVAQKTNHSQTTANMYLNRLVSAGLMTAEKDGRTKIYSLNRDEENIILDDVHNLSKELDEKYIKDLGIKLDQMKDNIYNPITGENIELAADLDDENTDWDFLTGASKTPKDVLGQNKASGSLERFSKNTAGDKNA